jgi:predicted O-methyltransferase YrrM
VLGVDSGALGDALRESSEVTQYCAGQLRRHSLVLPGLLNPNYGPVLYAAARILRPAVVVETGVGSGVSSTFFLSALEKNGEGRLYSIDLPTPRESLLPAGLQTGWLVPDRLRPRWELTLGDARLHLPPTLHRLGRVDLFYHDSDHSYGHMTWEYTVAYPHIRRGGLLLSDDVTSNDAWDEFTSGLDGPTARINRTGVHHKRGDRTPPGS